MAESSSDEVALILGKWAVTVEPVVARTVVREKVDRTVTVVVVVVVIFLLQHSFDELETQLRVAARAPEEFPLQSPGWRRYSVVASGIPMEDWDSERYTWAARSEEAGQVEGDEPLVGHEYWEANETDSQDQEELGRATAFRWKLPLLSEVGDL